MIKGHGSSEDTSWVILGLSEKNIEKLKNGEPIKVNGDEINIPNTSILIMYGRTESDMLSALKDSEVSINRVKDYRKGIE